MCYALYLASSKKLPHKPFSTNRFYTKDLDDEENSILKHFSLPYVFYLGSNEGCSCKFWSTCEEDREKNVIPLAYYLLEALKIHHAQIELFASWEGKQSTPPTNRITVSIEEFVNGDDFPLSEGDLATITPK